MPDEYVVAQHDFTPEHDDEIEFKVGELILIVEKDEQYGDGWWQGRNPAGKTGLFPQSYTKPYDPLAVPEPRAPTTLGPLTEEEESTAEPSSTSRPPSPEHQPVMHATLSDIQEAIEQLAVRRDTDTDAGRSFSFVSTNGAETEPDTEEEGEHNQRDAQEFRKTLAERAEKVNQRNALEQPDSATTDPVGSALGFLRRRSSSNLATAPPISVELSDESDADDEDEDEEVVKKRHEHDIHPHHHKYRSSTSTAIKVGDTPTDTAAGTPRQVSGSLPSPPDVTVVEPPPLAAPRPQTPTTATASGFPSLPEPSQRQLPATAKPSLAAELAAALPSSSPAPATAPVAVQTSPANIPLPTSPSPARMVNVTVNGVTLSHVQGSYIPAPSPQAVASALRVEEQVAATAQQPSIPATLTPALTPATEMPTRTLATTLAPTLALPVARVSTPSADSDPLTSLKRVHPSEWTVDQVVTWLRSKNVDDATCAKFIEQEITGDVLLELDVNILKEEMGITVLGKRMRIANAIVELKRPASFSSEPASVPMPMSQASSGYGGSVMGSGFVGAQNGYVAPSGLGVGSMDQYPFSYPNVVSPSMNGRRMLSEEGSASVVSVGEESLKVPKSRPAQLALSSPSDSALHTKVPAQVTEEGAQEITNTLVEEDRAVQSENETPATSSTFPSRRRRFLGLSTESSSSRGSKDRKSTELTSIPNSPALRGDKDKDSNKSARVSIEDGVGKHVKAKKSLDAGNANGLVGTERSVKSSGGDRLSFFGATLGKSRKPPPRYSIYDDSVSTAAAASAHPERSSRSISRFMTSGKKSGRPGTAPSGAGVVPFGGGVSKDDTFTPTGSVRDPALLRKRHISTSGPVSPPATKITSSGVGDDENGLAEFGVNGEVQFRPGQSVLDQIGEPDHAGWLRKKGERYNSWKLRYLVLRGPHLYYLKSNSRMETKIKGYIPVHGYKVVVDENLNPGKYGFRLVHEAQPAHFFSSDEQPVIREWMKALMKATIDRDYSRPVVSSCNIPTIPLTVAQTMSPAPRPPSPTARDATQRALRRENPNQLSSRDARVLMGLPGTGNENGKQDPAKGDTFFTYNVENAPNGSTPPRPSRVSRTPSLSNRPTSVGSAGTAATQMHGRTGSVDRVDSASEGELIEWANSILPEQYRIHDVTRDLRSGLALLRLAESIKGRPSEPPVSDSVFKDENNIDGMFKLFDYLLDNDVKMGSVSINDIKQGRTDKTTQLLKALRHWHEKRKALAKSIGKSAGTAGPWMAMETGTINW